LKLADCIKAYLKNEYCLEKDTKGKNSRLLQTTETRPGLQILEPHGNLMMMTTTIFRLTVRINIILYVQDFCSGPLAGRKLLNICAA
jgi:hypothetical protein